MVLFQSLDTLANKMLRFPYYQQKLYIINHLCMQPQKNTKECPIHDIYVANPQRVIRLAITVIIGQKHALIKNFRITYKNNKNEGLHKHF